MRAFSRSESSRGAPWPVILVALLAALAILPGAAAVSSDSLRRGLLLARQGEFEQAVAAFREHTTAFPDDPEGRMHLGRTLVQMDMKLRRPPWRGSVSWRRPCVSTRSEPW